MIARLRSFAFAVIFYGGSVPIVIMAYCSALLGQKALRRMVLLWLQYHRLVAHHVMGIVTHTSGQRPATPALYAAKHQSFYETLELTRMLDAPAVVMKQELGDIPFWGWAARRYGAIFVDREASASALRRILREGRAAQAAGRSVLIFPEGTRVSPGEAPPLKAGFAGLYRALGMQVVPVALESAHVWPRHGPKQPGIVDFRFGAALPPGLPRAEAEAAAHAGINAFEGVSPDLGDRESGNRGFGDTAPRISPPSPPR